MLQIWVSIRWIDMIVFFYQFGDFDLGGRTAISGPTSKVPPTTTRRPTQLPVI